VLSDGAPFRAMILSVGSSRIHASALPVGDTARVARSRLLFHSARIRRTGALAPSGLFHGRRCKNLVRDPINECPELRGIAVLGTLEGLHVITSF
jgi:hypothetical protein